MKTAIRICTVVALAVPWLAIAQPPPQVAVPIDVQVGLIVNIWKLDRNFDSAKVVTLAVVYQESYSGSVNVKDDLLVTIERQKVRVVAVPYEIGRSNGLRETLMLIQADAIYVAPLRGIDIAAIAEICRERHLRSITGIAEYVEAGIAVGFGIRKNRPLIIVNLRQARAEGAAFSSQLLELARIVGPL